MLRIWTSVFVVFILSCSGLCSAQGASSQSSAGSPSQAASSSAESSPPSATATASEEDDDDSPDIPPVARGRISGKEYLQLRDKHIGVLRGVKDLARNPHARSQAIRTIEAQEQRLQRMQPASLNTSAGASSTLPLLPLTPTWVPLGPDPIPNGQTIVQEVPVSGRVTAIAIDPTDSAGDTVYVGTAQGGLYRSLDGGSTWTPLMDNAQSLAIGAITIDPLDHTKVFVGTGEGNLSLDSFFGVGVFLITGANSGSPVVTGPFNAPTTFPSPNADGFTDVFTGRSITQI